MSHNIKLAGVKFTDLTLLGEVVKDISKGAASLDTTAKTFRTYFGQPNKCDARINMPGPYDVALMKQPEGFYSATVESMMQPILGTRDNPIGLVQQEYILREAEYEAAQRGMTTERIEGPNGRKTLRMVMAD